MVADPYCIPCERYECWIEIDVRDEHNRSFSGQIATLTDDTGHTAQVILADGPTLVQGLAMGPVAIQFETQSWLKVAQSREARLETTPSQIPAYTTRELGHQHVKREHIKVTTGDLCLTPPTSPLPAAHQAGMADQPRFITNHAYVIEVKGYQHTILRIGVFFDGTGNNTHNALAGLNKVEQWLSQTCDDPVQRATELRGCQMGKRPVTGSTANDVTNIGKLSTLYLTGKDTVSSAVYISGIGTRDPLTGKKGHEYRSDDTLTQGLDLDFGGEDTSIIGKVTLACRDLIVQAVDKDLKNVLPTVEPIHRIVFDVFGFSRGAAAARHFVNLIDQKRDHPLVQAVAKTSAIRLKTGFDWASRDDVRIAFVGLFDTVKSSLNSRVNIQLQADSAERVVHLTAQDEVRKYFPLSRITSDAEGNHLPPHFTELALPGAHSDIGGGYYSRWSLQNPNSDPVLTECIELERFMSEENISTPDSASRAYRQAQAYAEEKRAMGWVDHITPWLSRAAIPALGAISLIPYSFRRYKGKDDFWPKKGVYVEVWMRRVVEGEYSRIPLHMMVEAGRAAGVPFKKWDNDDPSLTLTPLAEKQCIVSLDKIDQIWSQTATAQGEVKNLAKTLCPDMYRALRRHYLHHSANHQGIANSANTSRHQQGVSKEQRERIGNNKA